MELSLDEILTYLNCPAAYYYKYVKKIEAPESINIAYRRAIHKTVSYLYFSMMGEMVPSAKQMKDKWASLWSEYKNGTTSLTDMILKEHPQSVGKKRPEMDKHIIQGMELIHNFYHYNKDSFGIPIAVDHEFRVPISGITVTGKFELIRETIDKSSPNRFIEIVDFKTGAEQTDMFLVRNDLNLTIASYAFRNLFQAKEDRIVLSYLKTGKEIYTSRSDRQYDRMKEIVEGVAEGIANKRFYPNYSYACKMCPYRDYCDAGKI